MHRLRFPIAAGPALAALIAGCATQQPAGHAVQSSRTYEIERTQVMQRIETFLERQDIEATTLDVDRGLVRARQEPLQSSGWADCSDRVIHDSEGERRRHVDPEGAMLELAIEVSRPPGQTRVAVRPTFEATYHNSFTNRDFEGRCRSTGALEQALLQAI